MLHLYASCLFSLITNLSSAWKPAFLQPGNTLECTVGLWQKREGSMSPSYQQYKFNEPLPETGSAITVKMRGYVCWSFSSMHIFRSKGMISFKRELRYLRFPFKNLAKESLLCSCFIIKLSYFLFLLFALLCTPFMKWIWGLSSSSTSHTTYVCEVAWWAFVKVSCFLDIFCIRLQGMCD